MANCRFTPPTQAEPQVETRVMDLGPDPNRLRRYMTTQREGRNVWKISDGNYTFTQPFPTLTAEMVKGGGVGDDDTATYEIVYLGGHVYTVSDTECTALTTFLTAQGYNPDDWLTTVIAGAYPGGYAGGYGG